VYRPRFPREPALEMLEDGRGTHFDADVLDALTTTIARTGRGSTAALNRTPDCRPIGLPAV
jgi:HD-GYP domain-containing protein (c-di-GMP phosphodiesterase class II)